MIIRKLTITPINCFCKGFVTHNPNQELALLLIKERLLSGNRFEEETVKPLKRLPKFLRGWLNPRCAVVKNRKYV